VSIKIGKVLRHFGYYSPAYYPWIPLRNISRLKDSVPVGEKSGVYSLKCNHCNAIYVGQTGSLSVRVDEHTNAWLNGKPKKQISLPILAALVTFLKMTRALLLSYMKGKKVKYYTTNEMNLSYMYICTGSLSHNR